MTTAPHTAYVLMTPARNEERNMPRVLATVAAQTIRPLRWVIVDDGSTDRTAEIVEDFAREHGFVRMLRREQNDDRTFASKAHALRMAYKSVRKLDFAFIGNLDADMELAPDYYKRLLGEFATDTRLGLAGGLVWDVVGDRTLEHKTNLGTVAGAVQTFRRDCYEAIGGYYPSAFGGIDTIAEVGARMRGWRVRTFPEYRALHHREEGTAVGGTLRACRRVGFKDYMLGYHPLFYIFMCLRRATDRPYLLRSLLRGFVFYGLWLRREPRQSPPEIVAFMQREQLHRIFGGFCRSKSDPKASAGDFAGDILAETLRR